MEKKGKYLEGWASVEIFDSEGELIPMEKLKEEMPTALKRGMPITVNHSDNVVGELTDYEFKFNEEQNAEGLWVKVLIFDDYPSDKKAWEDIDPTKKGKDDKKLSQFSIGGEYSIADDGTAKWIAPITLAITQKGMNPGADIVEKKEDTKSTIQTKDGESMEEDKKDTSSAKKEEKVEETKKEDKVEKSDDIQSRLEKMEKAYGEVSELKKEYGDRLAKIEAVLDSISEEEDKEHGTDKAIEEKEDAKKAKKEDEPCEKEDEEKKEAEHSKKEIASIKSELVELKAKFSKMENTVIRKTNQSYSPSDDTGMMATLQHMNI
jgi:hypothetical protein